MARFVLVGAAFAESFLPSEDVFAIKADATKVMLQCHGEQKEAVECGVEECYIVPDCSAVDGTWGDWGYWSPCGCTGVQERNREVLYWPSCGGAQLQGVKVEVQGCLGDCKEDFPKDCEFAPWQGWSTCDRSCGIGQKFRLRETFGHVGCGAACTGPTRETAECELIQCPDDVDCKFSEWEPWSPCPVTCGGGQQARTRIITTEATVHGVACMDKLHETRGCNVDCCDGGDHSDCSWGPWLDWGDCTRGCDGGHRMRMRTENQTAQNGGKTCPRADTIKLVPCNENSCAEVHGIDAEWGPWMDWSVDGEPSSAWCSKTCGGGQQLRKRMIAKEVAFGGNPLIGDMNEFRECYTDECPVVKQDCEWNDWQGWSDCRARINGIRDRFRTIHKYSDNGGEGCEGAVREMEPCNKPEDLQVDEIPDVELSDWTDWSDCTRSCNNGTKTRSREITNEGKGAEKVPLSEVHYCNKEFCCVECEADVDCEWDEWGGWSACSRTCGGGEHTRWRSIKVMSKNRGKSCDSHESYQVAECHAGQCQGVTEFCVWSDWGYYTECSASCGGGAKERARNLQVTQSEPSSKEDYIASQNLALEIEELSSSLAKSNNAIFAMAGIALTGGVFLLNAQRRPVVQVAHAE